MLYIFLPLTISHYIPMEIMKDSFQFSFQKQKVIKKFLGWFAFITKRSQSIFQKAIKYHKLIQFSTDNFFFYTKVYWHVDKFMSIQMRRFFMKNEKAINIVENVNKPVRRKLSYSKQRRSTCSIEVSKLVWES